MIDLRFAFITAIGAVAALSSPADSRAAAGDGKTPIVACTLTSAEKRARRAELERDLLPRVRATDELADGWVLWFDRAEGELARVASFVEFESRCCAFLDFAIRLDRGSDRIALELRGPEGAKEALRPLVERSAVGAPD